MLAMVGGWEKIKGGGSKWTMTIEMLRISPGAARLDVCTREVQKMLSEHAAIERHLFRHRIDFLSAATSFCSLCAISCTSKCHHAINNNRSALESQNEHRNNRQ